MTRWIVGIVVIARVAYAQPTDGAKARAAELFERGRLDVVQRADYATACALFEQSYGLDMAPGTALNIGDCNEHLGRLADALRWYEEAEHLFAAAQESDRETIAHGRADAVRARMATPAPAASGRTAWRATFWISAATTLAGGAVWLYGYNQMNDATDKLCAGGAYTTINASCPVPAMPLTKDQVSALNLQGNRGRTDTIIGGGTAFLASAVAAIALYEGYLRPEPKRAHDVVIVPALGGAVVSGAW